jgi:hypothetical protein
MKKPIIGILTVSFLFFLSSCGGDEKQEATANADLTVEDSTVTAYQRPVITISEANTDLESIENIERPATSEVINPKFPLSSLYGIWTYDPEGPHADFELNEKWFFVVDYDGNGDMPYIIKQDSIIVYYNDFISKGLIKEATSKNLKISWDGQEATEYVKWTQ